MVGAGELHDLGHHRPADHSRHRVGRCLVAEVPIPDSAEEAADRRPPPNTKRRKATVTITALSVVSTDSFHRRSDLHSGYAETMPSIEERLDPVQFCGVLTSLLRVRPGFRPTKLVSEFLPFPDQCNINSLQAAQRGAVNPALDRSRWRRRSTNSPQTKHSNSPGQEFQQFDDHYYLPSFLYLVIHLYYRLYTRHARIQP